MCYIIYNNILGKEQDLVVPVFNRGLMYGDGFFETIIFANGKLQYYDQHYLRLTAAAVASKIELPSTLQKDELKAQIFALIDKNNLGNIQRIRITCWRGGLGLYTPQVNTAEFLITVSVGVLAPPIKQVVGIFEDMYKPYSELSPFKTLSANIYVQAGIARETLQADDMVILGANRTIAECGASNIFFIKDNQLFTPSLFSGCIEGIIRNEIIKWCASNEEICVQKEISITEVLDAEMVFTANVTGLSAIMQIAHKKFATNHLLAEKLFQKFTITPL